MKRTETELLLDTLREVGVLTEEQHTAAIEHLRRLIADYWDEMDVVA